MLVLKVVQWLHILCGLLWFGGYIFTMFVVWPVLLRRPVAEARAIQSMIEKVAAPLFGVAAFGSILLGIIRGIWLGPLKTWSAFTTPYAHAWMSALVWSIGLIVFGVVFIRRLPKFVWDGDALRPKAATRVWQAGFIGLFFFSIILFCMVAMHFGG